MNRAPRRILIATDAWVPQVNGVVRTLQTTIDLLQRQGHAVEVVEPGQFSSWPVPFYPEVAMAFPWPHKLADRIKAFRPDHVHISTEGTIGLLVRRSCMRRRWRFSTAYHTRYAEYLERLAHIPASLTYRYLRWFHGTADRLMVATPSLEADLIARGFKAPMGRWSRGVDLKLFRPRPKTSCEFPKPILLYVGRVSHEKGIEEFLKLTTPGTKVIVGDGPARAELESKYPAAKFLGYRKGEALGECYAMGDLFVFPSKTDTFGLVVIEALATGLPVAAYPVTGPMDIITRPEIGALNDNLGIAIEEALKNGQREECIKEAQNYTWEHCTEQFLKNLAPISPRYSQDG
jgi:glycosyltransferase involved in cell wall biosynthesis